MRTANSADSAQNQQISTVAQGTVQGFTGIAYLTISHRGACQPFPRFRTNRSREKSANLVPDCEVSGHFVQPARNQQHRP